MRALNVSELAVVSGGDGGWEEFELGSSIDFGALDFGAISIGAVDLEPTTVDPVTVTGQSKADNEGISWEVIGGIVGGIIGTLAGGLLGPAGAAIGGGVGIAVGSQVIGHPGNTLLILERAGVSASNAGLNAAP